MLPIEFRTEITSLRFKCKHLKKIKKEVLQDQHCLHFAKWSIHCQVARQPLINLSLSADNKKRVEGPYKQSKLFHGHR